ncbi:hypothetical protein [Marinilactibacillus psychrotolerans]|uniref:hypothetical protein n=1 Tax=Marinilactibacillus psychrotolerans TaxID=191770 RepID=UPI003883FE5C
MTSVLEKKLKKATSPSSKYQTIQRDNRNDCYCPITSTKRFGFIEIDKDQKIKGCVTPLQFYTFDFIIKFRLVEYIEPLNNEDMAAVVQIVENIFKLWKLNDSANGEPRGK